MNITRFKSLLGILSVWGLSLCGQTVSSSCTAPDSVVWKYRKSADKLTVRRVDYIGDTYKDSVAINRQISDQYLRALLAVYNATALPARDTVVGIPVVMDKYPLSLNLILVDADSTQPWMQNLRKDIIPCGEPGVDYLIDKYYLKKDTYYHFFGAYPSHSIVFQTDSNCYIRRLCDKFGALMTEGVVFSQPLNEGQTYSKDIRDSINPNFIDLTYSFGWGDIFGCLSPGSCPYRRHWAFRVYNDCSVEYKGCYGDPLPPYIMINPGLEESADIRGGVKIYPNPAKDRLAVSFASEVPGGSEVVILNSLGQPVYRHPEPKRDNSIDVSFLPPGIYTLGLEGHDRNRYCKFIKE